jgi:hypothetical protein
MRAAVINPAPPGRRNVVFRFHKSLMTEKKCRCAAPKSEPMPQAATFLVRQPHPGGTAFAANPMDQAMTKTAQQTLARQLCDSVDGLQKQVEKVEFWASALTGFTQPVPEYDPETSAIARYVKPGRPPRKRRHRRSAQQKDAGAKPASA